MAGLKMLLQELDVRMRAASLRRQLGRLDDRQLEDIGLARYQLDEAAWVAARSPRKL